MHIALECSNCGLSSQVSYSQLCRIWKKGYETMEVDRRDRVKAVAVIKCQCGHTDKYNTPMLSWVFQTVFDEFVKETNTTR
jgi:hypothetical protein